MTTPPERVLVQKAQYQKYLHAAMRLPTVELTSGDNQTHTGLFSGQDSQQLMTFVGGKVESGVVGVLVGDYVTVGVSGYVIAQSVAATGALADVDSQIRLNWGIHPFDSAVEFVNVTYPGESVPDNSEMTVPTLIELLPPRPSTVVPEPGSLTLLASVVPLGILIFYRRRCRSGGKAELLEP